MIKAIETPYKGYQFRSRLEARWAVFFDTLGVEWEYETEGLDLTDAYQSHNDNVDDEWTFPWPPLKPGERVLYLPDFYLPKYNKYVEIKPYHGHNWWGEGFPLLYEKICVMLGGLLVHGMPGTIEEGTYEICVDSDVDHYFGYCPKCHTFGQGYCAWVERICPHFPQCGYTWHKERLDATPQMLDAIQAARSARFEHGYSGRKRTRI